MSPRTARIALTLTIALAAPAAEAGVLVSFHPKATVEGGLVTLADVADVRSTDPAEAQRLSSVILGPAPAAGQQSPLEFETVRSRLAAAGANLAEVEFSGPRTINLSGPTALPDSPAQYPRPHTAISETRRRAEQAVTEAVRRYLAAKAGLTSVMVELKSGDADAVEIASAEARGFDVSGGAAPWTGPQNFTLRFLDAESRVRELQVSCVVSVRPSVLAAKRAITKGQIIRPDDLVWKKAETDAEAGCAADPAQIIGHEAQQPIRTGQAIPANAVRVVPLVRAGQFVTVTSRRPGIAIQRIMKAKSDGAAGETVSLLTLEDHKTVRGRVTGLQEAEVVDGPAPGPASIVREASGPQVVPATYEDLPTYRPLPADDAPRVLVNPSQTLTVPIGPAG